MINYVAPKSDKYKAELIHKETGEVGSILRDSLKHCILWAEKCRSEKFATRITGKDIYHYDSFSKKPWQIRKNLADLYHAH